MPLDNWSLDLVRSVGQMFLDYVVLVALLFTQVVANLFFSHAQLVAQQKTMMGKTSTIKRKYKPPTVAAKFQQSLLDLVEKMERWAGLDVCWKWGPGFSHKGEARMNYFYSGGKKRFL